jgi:penicillin-binding protein 2
MSTLMNSIERNRLLLFGGIVLVAFFTLGMTLWNIQIVQGAVWMADQRRQSRRLIRLPGIRGRIEDRNGAALAENQPDYRLVLRLEQYRQSGRWSRTVEAVARDLERATAIVGRPSEEAAALLGRVVHSRRALPVTLWTGLTPKEVARFLEHRFAFRGLEIEVVPRRVYPQGSLAGHVLGYVGEREWTPEETRAFHMALPEPAGRSGIERQYDALLRGEPGCREVRVDAAGYPVVVPTPTTSAVSLVVPPRAGGDVRLTLDVPLQHLAEAAMGNVRGALVAMDPRTGDLLALCSCPGFDPNRISGGISAVEWQALQDEAAGRPLFPRAIAAFYPPGSLFKPIVAMAALEKRVWHPDTPVRCDGVFERGAIRVRCSSTYGHGTITLEKAIEVSCNPYFCEMGLTVGLEPIRKMAAELGLGRRTGIELAGESAGLLPDAAWKRRRFGEGWREGDTANLAIGQGFLGVTPLQMALVAAAFATGGRVPRPRLVRSIRHADGRVEETSVSVRDLGWSAEHWQAVARGLRRAVESPTGTARSVRLSTVPVAAKTGTAEYGVKGSGLKYAWMMAIAPADAPQIVLVAVIEEGESGGQTAGPIVRRVLSGLWEGGDEG